MACIGLYQDFIKQSDQQSEGQSLQTSDFSGTKRGCGDQGGQQGRVVEGESPNSGIHMDKFQDVAYNNHYYTHDEYTQFSLVNPKWLKLHRDGRGESSTDAAEQPVKK